MKKVLSMALSVVLIAALFTMNHPSAASKGFMSEAELLEIKSHIEDDADMNEYATVQGACTDGTYAYFAVQQGSTSILKYNMHTWELDDVKEDVNGLGHANDMAYNAKRNLILVANNGPDYKVLTALDASTLEIKATVKLKLEVYSVAYNPDRDIYIVGISGSYNFAILNHQFKVVKKYKGVNTGYTRQGCDCDENYIYFPQSGGNNVVVVYDYNGKYVDMVPMGHTHEVENLFHIGSSFYTTLHYYGNSVQRIGLSDSTLIRYTVYYHPGEGRGEMKPTSVHYGEDTPLRANTFTRYGYFFGGWRASRSCDGKILGYRKFSDESEWLEKEDVYEYALYTDREEVARTVEFGSVTMTPFWINEQYTVHFEPGDALGHMEDKYVGYAEDYVIPENHYVMQGYIFTGYTAYRDCDGRYYGYRKNSESPEWLEKEDMDREYVFKEGEVVSRMTYDGTFTLKPRFRFAFTYSDDGTELLEYIGKDPIVEIPDPHDRLTGIASGAFSDNDLIREIHIPASVENVDTGAVVNCSQLQGVYFDGGLPQDLALDSIVNSNRPMVFIPDGDGHYDMMGLTGTKTDTQFVQLHAAAYDYLRSEH